MTSRPPRASRRITCLRIFKAVYGRTPNAYLTQKRVQVAERLLRNSSAQIDEVAANVGFRSRTTLFRQMRQFRGLSPSTIRRRGEQALPGDADDSRRERRESARPAVAEVADHVKVTPRSPPP